MANDWVTTELALAMEAIEIKRIIEQLEAELSLSPEAASLSSPLLTIIETLKDALWRLEELC